MSTASLLISLVLGVAACSKADPCSCQAVDKALSGTNNSEVSVLQAIGAGKLVVIDDCDDQNRRVACEKSAVTRILRDGTPELRTEAALAAAARDWRDLAPAIEGLFDQSQGPRQAAYKALATLAPDRLEAHRSKIAAEADRDVRARIALEAMMDKDLALVPVMIGWLAEENEASRVDSLARALAGLEARDAVRTAIAAGVDGPGLVKVLSLLGDRSGLEAALAANSPRVRLAAIDALAQENDRSNVEPFIRTLDDQDSTVRARAVEVLSPYGAVPGVEEALRRHRRKR